MTNAYIYDGLRSPFGRFAGTLSTTRPDDLLAAVIRGLIAKNLSVAADVEDVIAGCTNQAGEDARNVARHAGLLSGIPVTAGGITVNRLCGSGMAAVLDASRGVKSGEGDLFVAGGTEVMSRAPFVMAKAETAFSRTATVFDSTIGARFPNPKIESEFGADTMPETAENVAKQFDITREECDAFAARSQAGYFAAFKDGFFKDEIIPIEIPVKKKGTITFAEDEHPREGSTADVLAGLRTLFPEGVVTAGNASGVNDGAGALLVGSEEAGKKHDMRPRARIIAGAISGVEPRVMGLGPVDATKKALARAGLELKDMDLIEINEAFAAQVLGCTKALGIANDDSRLNPNGGAISIGHPLGASGARICLTTMRQLERMDGKYAVASMCIGVGQGIAVVIERV